MTDEEVHRFWLAVSQHTINGQQRQGQAMMNALYDVAPELYFDVSQTSRDIFYRDTSQDIYRFRAYLGI